MLIQSYQLIVALEQKLTLYVFTMASFTATEIGYTVSESIKKWSLNCGPIQRPVRQLIQMLLSFVDLPIDIGTICTLERCDCMLFSADHDECHFACNDRPCHEPRTWVNSIVTNTHKDFCGLNVYVITTLQFPLHYTCVSRIQQFILGVHWILAAMIGKIQQLL